MTYLSWFGVIGAAAYLLRLGWEIWVTADAVLKWDDEKREAHE